MQVLDMLRTRLASRKTTADETLVSAANRVAAGETVDVAAVENALVDMGRDFEYFENMCTTARRRREWRVHLDRIPAATTRLEKARAAAERERAQFDKIAAAWHQRGRELDAEIHAAEELLNRGLSAREELTKPENTPGPVGQRVAEARAAVEVAETNLGALRRQQRDATERLKRNTDFREHHTKFNTHGPAGQNAADYDRLAKRAERELAELEPAINDAMAAVDDAKQELAAAEAAAVKV